MENLKEIRKKLQHLSDQIDKKNNLLYKINMSEEEYIKNNSDIEQPMKRCVTNVLAVEQELAKHEKVISNIKANTMIKTIAGWPILIGCFVAAVMMLLLNWGTMGVLLLLPFFIIGVSFVLGAKKGKKQLAKVNSAITNDRARAKEKDEKNQQFNDTEYPELLKAYKKEVERLKPLYAEMRDSAHVKLVELVDEMEREEHILAEKYYGDIKKIIEIIDDGRATSLPEAINILISDQNAQKLLNEQIRQNEIQEQAAEMQRREAEAQRREMERHNREMEATANEQLQMEKNKIDYAKCHNCAHESYCYKKTCTGYRPK